MKSIILMLAMVFAAILITGCDNNQNETYSGTNAPVMTNSPTGTNSTNH